MIRLIMFIGVSLVLTVMPAYSQETSSPPSAVTITFTNLNDAVAFISSCLDKDDLKTLTSSCVGRKTSKPYLAENPKVFTMLKAVHKKTPLSSLYAKREFPKDRIDFKLGGCGGELGHVHIDFIKQESAWRIQDIWDCK